MRKYGTDQFVCAAAKIIAENKRFIKIRAAITAVGVYQYPDGLAFKSRRSLLNATRTVRSAKLTIGDHPASQVVMSQKDIVGECEKPYFERDKIWAVLNFDKALTAKHYIDQMHLGMPADVSIGFYYTHVPIAGDYKGKKYDYRMEDIVIDHVASFVLKGRCSFPDCGIGVDTMFKQLSKLKTDIVGKRGEEWCVFHCHPDGTRGAAIKCYSGPNAEEKANKMHRAIQARKHASYGQVSNLNKKYPYVNVDQDGKPPKAWWDNCTTKARSFADDPAKFCGWLYAHGDETPQFSKLKRSFGGASKKLKGGKKGLSQEESGEALVITPEDEEACVKQRLEEYPEMSREEAEALCKAVTKPEDEPTPPGGTLTDQEQSPYQKCIVKYTSEPENMSLEEAIEKCKEEGHVKADQDAAFENCVARKMEEGMTREEAEKECRAEHPVAEEDQEEEPTPLEKCIDMKVEEGMTHEEATEWCEADLAGEHEKADSLIAESQKLLKLKGERDTSRMIEARRRK